MINYIIWPPIGVLLLLLLPLPVTLWTIALTCVAVCVSSTFKTKPSDRKLISLTPPTLLDDALWTMHKQQPMLFYSLVLALASLFVLFFKYHILLRSLLIPEHLLYIYR